MANCLDAYSDPVNGKAVVIAQYLALCQTSIANCQDFIENHFASLVKVDQTLELAAKNLGAPPVTVFRTITLPLIMPGVLSGMIFAFIASWDEVVIASFLSTSRVSTVPVQIFSQLREALDPSAAAISSLLLLASVSLVSLLALVRRQSNKGNTK